MDETPMKNRRATIFVTGPQTKRTIYADENDQVDSKRNEKDLTLQDLALARKRLHKDMIVVNTTTGIEILVQIIMDEFEVFRHHLREKGAIMRQYFNRRLKVNKLREFILQLFSKNSKNMLEYRQDAEVILNEAKPNESWKPPKYTLNDIEEILLTDDLEDGVVQRRSKKWDILPVRVKPEPEDDDSFCEFRKMNVPMTMTFEDDDDDQISMPSTRTAVTTENQMQAIQAQLAMLSKQLLTLQKTTTASIERKEGGSSRASSRRGGKHIKKEPSVEISSNSSSSDTSEDEGKGASVCSPAMSLQRKITPPCSSSSIDLPPIVASSIPPPPPPPPMNFNVKKTEPAVVTKKDTSNKRSANSSLPAQEAVVTSRPYLTDIANGRSMLKKTVTSPGGSPANYLHARKPISSFEAALRDRFRGFHGDASFSEQEETENDEDFNATWDE